MKKIMMGTLMVIVLAWLINSLLSSSMMMEMLKKEIKEPNPMSYVYDRSPEEVEFAIRNGLDRFKGMYLDLPGERILFTNASRPNVLPPKDYFMSSVIESYVYRKKNRGRYYDLHMYIHVDSLGPQRTRVTAETIDGDIISGYRPGITHMSFIVPVLHKVEPSTVEEYQMLYLLGHILNVRDMPRIKYPKGLSREELMRTHYRSPKSSNYDKDLMNILFPE